MNNILDILLAMSLAIILSTPQLSNYVTERHRAQAVAAQGIISHIALKAQTWCENNGDSCTGITIAGMQTEKLITTAEGTVFNALPGASIADYTDSNGNDTYLIKAGPFDPAAIGRLRDSAGAITYVVGDTYICDTPGNAGMYKGASTC